MAGTYCLGVFNDSFFKQAVFLIAVSLGMKEMQGYVAIVFTLPYIFLAAPAGWLADRFAKRHVVIAAKVLELTAMIAGAAGILLGAWYLVLTMAFIMGLQSCVFSPALNGAIPELFPPAGVTRANAVLKAVVTVAILAGFASAGIVRDLGGAWALSTIIIGAALLGVFVSFATPYRPPADPDARFPWWGIVDTLKRLVHIRRDPPLAHTVVVAVFIWSLGQLQLLLINPMGVTQFGWSDSATSLLLACELVGIAIGGVLAGRWAAGKGWQRLLAPSLAVMAGLLGAVWAVPLLPGETARYGALMFLLLGGGITGGLVLIPCEAFIQVRPAAGQRGAVIASANFAIFCGIALAGGVANLLNLTFLPTDSFALVAAVTGLFAYYVYRTLSERQRL